MRESAFRQKFEAAASELHVSAADVVSVKLRDIVPYQDYQALITELSRSIGPHQFCPVGRGDFQGRAYSLTVDQDRVLIIEHETGLELLYIAGSVASLVSIVPMVLRLWRRIRHSRPDQGPSRGRFEFRYLDRQGRLIEIGEDSVGPDQDALIFLTGFRGAYAPPVDSQDVVALLHARVSMLERRLFDLERRIEGPRSEHRD
jgi:hypothetical protein